MTDQHNSKAPREGFHLDAYLRRIGHAGSREPTLATLRSLHARHPAAIPFENLDPFQGHEVTLEAPTLQSKLVDRARGGYCFEQNLLFLDALRALGFCARGLAARVMWNRPPDFLTPRSHMLLEVTLDEGKWIADVGFGGLTLTGPLRLAQGEQETPHEPFRLRDEGDGHFTSEALIGGEWRPVYRFDLAESFEQDYAVTSYFLSTHPGSQFVTGLRMARALPGRRLALAGSRLTEHKAEGTSRRQIETPDELADLIGTEFGIDLPDRDAFIDTAREKGLFG